jgi:hypothetical protein
VASSFFPALAEHWAEAQIILFQPNLQLKLEAILGERHALLGGGALLY